MKSLFSPTKLAAAISFALLSGYAFSGPGTYLICYSGDKELGSVGVQGIEKSDAYKKLIELYGTPYSKTNKGTERYVFLNAGGYIWLNTTAYPSGNILEDYNTYFDSYLLFGKLSEAKKFCGALVDVCKAGYPDKNADSLYGKYGLEGPFPLSFLYVNYDERDERHHLVATSCPTSGTKDYPSQPNLLPNKADSEALNNWANSPDSNDGRGHVYKDWFYTNYYLPHAPSTKNARLKR